jgi:hypothetical protein
VKRVQLEAQQAVAAEMRKEASPRAAPNSARSRVRWLTALVVAWAVVYLVQYVPARGNGSDFQVFYAGAYADAHGSDPFNWPQLWRVEQLLYNGGLGRHNGFVFAPYGDPPPFALVLRPLTLVGESDAYRIWAMLLLACGAAGAFLCLQGWPPWQRRAAALLVAISPAALFDLRLGQNATPLLLCLGLALALQAKDRPLLAGAALALGMYKPHLMLPVSIIVLLASPRRQWPSLAGGFALATTAGLAIGVVFDGGFAAYGSWLSSVRGFGDLIRHQPDLASIPGLYLGWASPAVSGALNLCCLVLAGLIVARLAFKGGDDDPVSRERLLGGGIAAYLALSPYVHTSDQVLLALPLLLLVGHDGRGLGDNAVLLAAAVTLLAPMVVIRDYHTVGINALPPICVSLAYWLRRSPRAMAKANTGLAGNASGPCSG